MPTPSHPIALAIFDLDGTLIDSVSDLAQAVDEALGLCALRPVGIARVRDWVGEGARVLLERAARHHLGPAALPPGLLSRLERQFDIAYRACSGRASTIYPGVEYTLDALVARGVQLACVTNKPLPHTLPLLRKLGLAGRFRWVLGGDSLPLRKPDPLPLEVVSIRAQTPLHACCMVGDSMNDLTAANRAGMASIAVGYGYAGGADLTLHAEAVIAQMDQLVPTLQQLGRLQ
jgi:phosphoglycolate phosphatase